MINFYLAQKACRYPDVPYPKLTTLAKIEHYALLIFIIIAPPIVAHAISPQKNFIITVKTARIIVITWIACFILRFLTLTFMDHVEPLQRQNRNLNDNLQRAREDSARLQRDVNTWQAANNRLERGLDTARTEVADLRQRRDTLTGALNRQYQEIERLHTAVAIREEEVAAWKTKEAKLEQREANQTELERNVRILNTKWENRKKSLPLTLEDTQASIDGLTKEKNELEREIAQLRNNCKIFVDEINARFGASYAFNE